MIIEAAMDYIRELFKENADGHGFDHSLRVYRLAVRIAETEPDADKQIVSLAALLHDTDDYKLFLTENNANARYFMEQHGVDPEGLHFTISDTGWGKAVWGKLYGQWLCEASIFTYDYADFYAKEILSMIQKYRITTFCAPPTVYRFLVHVDLSHYNLSSLKNVTTAGEALNPEIFRRFLAATGLPIMEGYGQTETTPYNY